MRLGARVRKPSERGSFGWDDDADNVAFGSKCLRDPGGHALPAADARIEEVEDDSQSRSSGARRIMRKSGVGVLARSSGRQRPMSTAARLGEALTAAKIARRVARLSPSTL